MIFVLGARGRFGQALCRSLPAGEVVAVDRSIYADWWRDDAAAEVLRYFESCGRSAPGSVVVVAAGVLDPAQPPAEHWQVNVELPSRVIQGACAAGLRVVTLGTVMERLVEHPNPYVAAKSQLGRFAASCSEAGKAVMHVQIHTLYGGGQPAPFMFLGQICAALREGSRFEMSPGRQLREYHHVDDDVSALLHLIRAETVGVVGLSHGAAVTLRDLATHIFSAVGREDLLHVGARPEPAYDNYATVLPRPKVLDGVDFRPTLPSVATYVQSVVANDHFPSPQKAT